MANYGIDKEIKDIRNECLSGKLGVTSLLSRLAKVEGMSPVMLDKYFNEISDEARKQRSHKSEGIEK
jgi:hypothetical protein